MGLLPFSLLPPKPQPTVVKTKQHRIAAMPLINSSITVLDEASQPVTVEDTIAHEVIEQLPDTAEQLAKTNTTHVCHVFALTDKPHDFEWQLTHVATQIDTAAEAQGLAVSVEQLGGAQTAKRAHMPQQVLITLEEATDAG